MDSITSPPVPNWASTRPCRPGPAAKSSVLMPTERPRSAGAGLPGDVRPAISRSFSGGPGSQGAGPARPSGDPVLFQFAEEGAAGHAEELGGAALVAPGVVEGVDEPLAFVRDELGVPVLGRGGIRIGERPGCGTPGR